VGKVLVLVLWGVGLEGLVEGLDEVGLLLLDVLVEGVADELDVLLGLALFAVVGGNERLLLVEVVEVLAVLLALEVGDPGHALAAEVEPVDAVEEGVVLDLVDAVGAEAVVGVAHEALEQVGGGWRQVGLLGNLQRLAPVQDLLARDRRVV
jgi:hypothetical protein